MPDAPPNDAIVTTPLTPEAHRSALAGTAGELRQVGDDHVVLRREGTGTLLVTFDTLEAARGRPDGLPIGSTLAASHGWATLDVLADGATWFRAPELHDLFDHFADEGMFETFARTIFAGGGMGGYGAAAFSVASPGAIVLTIQPRATLARDVAPWDRRFRDAYALDWSGRYGDASRLVEAASRVHVVYDPAEATDAMHATLFRGPHVIPLRAPQGGRDLVQRIESAKLMDDLIADATDGTLDPARFARLWRSRRQDPNWLVGLLRQAEQRDRPWLAAIVAARAVAEGRGKAATRRLDAALSRLDERGTPPPRGLRPASPTMNG